MKTRLACPNPDCGAVLSIEEGPSGRDVRCGKCGGVQASPRPGSPNLAVLADSPPPGGEKSPSWLGAETFELPEQLGRYRIIKKLGQGGMGCVYLAHDVKLNRPLALKVPFFHPSEGILARRRFQQEARAAATLDHPNLCPIYDVGELDGIPYLTMPYIEGKSLTVAMGNGRLIPETQAAALVRKLALALHEAHARGVVHRDLKPGNIMINRRRELIVMDFGLARMNEDGSQPLTMSGSILGTALYMAPEQASGSPGAASSSCDVYSLGVILYEMLAGVRPFEGPWSIVIGLKSVKDPEPPSVHRPDLDPGLDELCLKAIARNPADRFPDMDSFAAALGDFLHRGSAPTHLDTAAPDRGRGIRSCEDGPTELLGIETSEDFQIHPKAGESKPATGIHAAFRSKASRVAAACALGMTACSGLAWFSLRPGSPRASAAGQAAPPAVESPRVAAGDGGEASKPTAQPPAPVAAAVIPEQSGPVDRGDAAPVADPGANADRLAAEAAPKDNPNPVVAGSPSPASQDADPRGMLADPDLAASAHPGRAEMDSAKGGDKSTARPKTKPRRSASRKPSNPTNEVEPVPNFQEQFQARMEAMRSRMMSNPGSYPGPNGPYVTGNVSANSSASFNTGGGMNQDAQFESFGSGFMEFQFDTGMADGMKKQPKKYPQPPEKKSKP